MKPTEILVLDFNRKEELLTLLKSLKNECSFEHKIVVLNNGGKRYADEFCEQGLCDKVINNAINIGCGAATVQLFAQCESDFALYVQVDHQLLFNLSEGLIDNFKMMILSGDYFYVDLAGNQGNGVFSERPFFISKKNYFSAKIEFGGPGPLCDLTWSEESIQNHIKKNNLKFHSSYFESHNSKYPPFLDCGKWSVRENPDKSQWRHRPDSKELWLVKGPVKERHSYPKFNEEEWRNVLTYQSWPDGKIPEQEKANSFIVPQWH